MAGVRTALAGDLHEMKVVDEHRRSGGGVDARRAIVACEASAKFGTFLVSYVALARGSCFHHYSNGTSACMLSHTNYVNHCSVD